MNRLEYFANFGYYLSIHQNRWLRLSSDSRPTNSTVFEYVLLILTTQQIRTVCI